mmetsp:Transcript_76486/g.203120  ORF Transcript_76486/g.203120 Transcript_76486/m.203120 type:complete len:99 (+) Transcript_76486:252-548(+)
MWTSCSDTTAPSRASAFAARADGDLLGARGEEDNPAGSDAALHGGAAAAWLGESGGVLDFDVGEVPSSMLFAPSLLACCALPRKLRTSWMLEPFQCFS